MAYVEATRNPKANEQARMITDRDARAFRCRTDRARHYAVDDGRIDEIFPPSP